MNGNLTLGLDCLRDLHIQGTMLLEGPPAQHIIEWMKNTLDEIFPYIPIESPQYRYWEELSSKYKNCMMILPANYTHDIKITMDLIKASAFYLVCLDKSTSNGLPPQNLVKIHCRDLESLRDFVADKLYNELKGKEDGITKKTALLHTYGRLFLVVNSMRRLENLEDYQMLSSGLRSILELHIDMLLLHRDLIENSANKFFKFSNYIKQSRGQKIVNLKVRFGLLKDNDPVLDALKKTPKFNPRQIWGRDHLSNLHWTNLSIEERIEMINDREVADIFIHSYEYSNRLIHSGYLDFQELEKTCYLINWNSFLLSSRMFTVSSRIINSECQILNEAEFEKAIEIIQKKTQKEFLDEQIISGLKKKDP